MMSTFRENQLPQGNEKVSAATLIHLDDGVVEKD